MNIYEKLNKAKLALQAAGLKKSGKNDFAKYEYFELSDFLPTIIALEHEIGFTCAVSFGIEQATLEIVNTEKPDESILFTSPMSSASSRPSPFAALPLPDSDRPAPCHFPAFRCLKIGGLRL